MSEIHQYHLHLRQWRLTQDATGHNYWQPTIQEKTLPAPKLAILICDMWDKHWSRGASERVDIMAPRMNQVLHAARDCGVQIIHAPSDTLDFYADTPARRRILAAPAVTPPAPQERENPPLPIDDSDEGSDTGEIQTYKAWSRQHPALCIDQTRDVISDKGQEIYNFLCQQAIEQVLIMGVHTNMCVLNRSFGIKQMVKWGVEIALVRDLTDTMYNPARRPYVNHAEGTRLVVEYIEKFWCPSLLSTDLVG
ncbi:MAG: isochorismatase family protein [Caldilineaceae bacterium]